MIGMFKGRLWSGCWQVILLVLHVLVYIVKIGRCEKRIVKQHIGILKRRMERKAGILCSAVKKFENIYDTHVYASDII